MIKNVYRSSLFLSDFNESLIFSTNFRMILMSNFTKIRPVGAELFHADRQENGQKLIVAFRNFANARKNVSNKIYRKNQNTHFMFNPIFF